MNLISKLIIITLVLSSNQIIAQIDQSKMGAWYMYFFSGKISDTPLGFQGDVQYRNWDLGGDLEQLLLRGGMTYSPRNANIKFTLGYGNVTSGAYGPDKSTSNESRIYQEALFPVPFGDRIKTNHRFRYEQRFVDGQNFRTRYRYNLFLNIPLNNKDITDNTLYLAFYNEIFINGQRNIGNSRTVEVFDRNRFYSALGYAFSKNLKIQAGWMRQNTENWNKSQLQLSLHHNL